MHQKYHKHFDFDNKMINPANILKSASESEWQARTDVITIKVVTRYTPESGDNFPYHRKKRLG